MTGFAAVFRREMLSLWVTPVAWVVTVVFLLLQGWSFHNLVRHFSNLSELSIDQGPVQAYFGQSFLLAMSLMLICPALTMRLFAEERRSGTVEALLTAPVTSAAVVLGKYFATFATFVLMWAPTVLYIVILRKTGSIDWWVVGSSYLGVLTVGAGYLAVGVLMSAMTRSQMIALLLTVLVLFGLFVVSLGEYIFDPGPLRDFCAHVSIGTHMDEFSKGIVDLRRLVFTGSMMVLPLFFTVRVVDSWRVG